mmetsp:Transcript_15544/g.39387  ORF Transcript_15544/g.39387 Transcript_15544/m.39387 type:complete len:235 (+) Transcript_15544:103-807(+)
MKRRVCCSHLLSISRAGQFVLTFVVTALPSSLSSPPPTLPTSTATKKTSMMAGAMHTQIRSARGARLLPLLEERRMMSAVCAEVITASVVGVMVYRTAQPSWTSAGYVMGMEAAASRVLTLQMGYLCLLMCAEYAAEMDMHAKGVTESPIRARWRMYAVYVEVTTQAARPLLSCYHSTAQLAWKAARSNHTSATHQSGVRLSPPLYPCRAWMSVESVEEGERSAVTWLEKERMH